MAWGVGKLSKRDVLEMKELKREGVTDDSLVKLYKVNKSTVRYHTHKYTHDWMLNHRKKILSTVFGKKANAKSTVRYFIKKKILSRTDLLEILRGN